MLDAQLKSPLTFSLLRNLPPPVCRNGTSRPALRQGPSSVPPYALQKSIQCVSIGHPPFGVRLGRKSSPLTKQTALAQAGGSLDRGVPGYLASHVGQTNKQRIKCQRFKRCCTTTKPPSLGAALCSRCSHGSYHNTCRSFGPGPDIAPGRRATGEGPISPRLIPSPVDPGDRALLWSSPERARTEMGDGVTLHRFSKLRA
jgi:hypothetical protein